MNQVHYTTVNGTRSGRASSFYKSITDADTVFETQNCKAEQMGIKSRYLVASCDSEGLEKKDIR